LHASHALPGLAQTPIGVAVERPEAEHVYVAFVAMHCMSASNFSTHAGFTFFRCAPKITLHESR